MSATERVRALAARGLLAAAGVCALAWLLPALLGQQPTLVDASWLRIQVGHPSNLRLAAWLALLALAAVPTPRRAALLAQLEGFLDGRGRWLLPLALSAYAIAFKLTQHLAFGTGSYDLAMYHYAVRYAWQQGPTFMWAFGVEKNYLADHFSPMLLAFVPLDMIFRSPLVLLVGEGLVFGLGARAIAGLAGAMGLRPLLAQVAAGAYAVNVVAWESLGFDFTPR